MILDYSDYVSDKGSKGIVNYIMANSGDAVFEHKSVCPFCKKQIRNKVYYKEDKSYPDWLAGSFEQKESVVQCPACGWWEYQYRNSSDAILDGIRAKDIEYCSAVLRKYTDDSKEVPLNALREQLLKTPSIIYDIDPHKIEDLVRSVFSDYYPKCKVYAFGKTRDGGRDGVLVDDYGDQLLLQVKRRTKADHTEGVGVLRDLMGAAILEDNLKGCIFVSTADHFSKDAKGYAQKIVEKKIVQTFDLYDCERFLKLIDVTKNCISHEWEKLVRLS